MLLLIYMLSFQMNQKKTYGQLLDALATIAPNCQPNEVLVDFELARINLFKNYYLKSMISGCNLHLTKCKKFRELI